MIPNRKKRCPSRVKFSQKKPTKFEVVDKLLLTLLILIPLLFLLNRFFSAKPEPSSTIYVNPNNGDDRNNGTQTNPLKTLDLALNQAKSRNDIDYIALPKDAEIFKKSLSCTAFSDINNNWASEFIQALATQGIIKGYPNCTFQPDAKLTRAEYAALLTQAFNLPETQTVKDFVDVPPDFWAYNAIQRNYSNKFLVGLGDSNDFKPNDTLKRVEVVAPLVSGLKLAPAGDNTKLSFYEDSTSIPAWATGQIATATSNQLIVNYPNPKVLNPTQAATRAETVAMLYQALVETKQMPAINSVYIVPGDYNSF
ncbi:S-layer homology domain-containing protein [Leptolyngbya sp. GB1-A1]|uniref:S-layer homology domain-containing protein n=1 Tax=unclassified Leptolyngbya TaxID=2650499 RepID=UPI0019C1D639|nr:S-layer homology domain-containing protein [Cyanobacteria bacterium FACHB-502]